MSNTNLKNIQKELESLEMTDFKWNRKTRELDEITISPTVLIIDGQLIVSGEDGKGLIDYYGEFRDGAQYIHSKIEAVASKHGCYWEWNNPGSIVLVQ